MIANFESNVQYIKYLVNKEVSKRFFDGTLDNSIDTVREIAEEIIPGPKALFRCCIYKERHIIEDRVHLVMEPSKDNRVINVLDSACDECPIDRFVVTEACRGCLGHKCKEVCPKNAITIVNHRSYINQELCIECGRCKQVCPFNAISEVKRPCIRACSVGAVKMDENRKAMIDHDKCISCGACIYQCPFGAIVDKSFIIDVLNLLKNSWNNTSYHVYAVVAPAVSSQFPKIKTGQVYAAIKELGFHDVIEAAIGADMVSAFEAKEFAETVDEMGWKTSSCCPAFVDYVEKNYPQLKEHVSTAVSPMIAIGRAIKVKDSKAKVIFIGPCTAKKVEMKQEALKDAIDNVITFEELQAVFDAKGIDLASMEEKAEDVASSFGRNFGRTGGLTESVERTVSVSGLEVDLKAVRCNGVEECIKALKMASFGKLDGNFIEGMVCKHGCTGGAASLLHDAKGIDLINRHAKEASTDNPLDTLTTYPIDNIDMERIHHEKA